MKHLDRTNRIIVIVLSAIFLFSALDKIYHYRGFVDALRNYVLVPIAAAPLIAAPVICLEIVIGIGLLANAWRSTAALLAAGTLASFTGAIGLNHVFGGRGICGCWFTVTLAEGTTAHLLLNGMLMALAVMLWLDTRKEYASPTRHEHRVETVELE